MNTCSADFTPRISVGISVLAIFMHNKGAGPVLDRIDLLMRNYEFLFGARSEQLDFDSVQHFYSPLLSFIGG